MPAQTRLGSFHVFSETQHQASLAFIDDVKSTRYPKQQEQSGKQANAAAIPPWSAAATGSLTTARVSPASLAFEQVIELLVKIAPQLIQIRRTGIAFLSSPLRIVQSHDDSYFFCLI